MTQDRSAIQSLKLTPAEIRKVMDALNRKGGGAPTTRQRRMRVPFENANVIIECDDGSSSRVRYRVISRNLSTHGIAFIHGQFMHGGRSCCVEIPTLDSGRPVRVEGRVERCRLIAGRVHELGVVFAHPIELGKFVALDVMSEMRAREESRAAKSQASASAAQTANTISGNVLLVEDFESNRKLYSFWLSKLGLHVVEAATAETANNLLASEHFQLLIVDEQLQGDAGSSLIRQIRGKGVTSTIISISSDNSDATRKICFEAGADCFLPKPFERDILQRTVLENLKSQEVALQSDEVIHSNITDPEMQPLIEDFVRSLKKIMESIAAASQKNDMDVMRQMLRSLPEAAMGYGFVKLGAIAQQAAKLLQSPDTRPIEIRRSIDRLSNAAARCAA